MKRIIVLVAVVAATMVGPVPALAGKPGELDPSFRGDGIRFIDFWAGEDTQAVLRVGRGKILVTGYRNEPLDSPARYNLALARLEAEGRLDDSFGVNGRILKDITPRRYDPPLRWAPAPDGGVVVLGNYGNDRHYLARLDRADVLDRSLGRDGLVVDGFSDESVFPIDIVVQPSERIILLARTDAGSLLRAYRPDGSRATGFGRNGQVSIEGDFPEALQGLSDGRMLIVGQPDNTIGRTGRPESEKLIIDALLPDGSPDREFGLDGRARMPIDVPSGELIVNGATVLRNGAVAVAGEIGFFESDAFVARFGAGGRPDGAFGGGDGWRLFDLGPVDATFGVVGLSRGRLVVFGGIFQDRIDASEHTDVFLAGLRRDGRFWRRSGDGGIVRDDYGLGKDSIGPPTQPSLTASSSLSVAAMGTCSRPDTSSARTSSLGLPRRSWRASNESPSRPAGRRWCSAREPAAGRRPSFLGRSGTTWVYG